MNAMLVTLLVIDHDNVGKDIKGIIENQKFPNRCINPIVWDVNEKDIGDWDDNHPLNKWNTMPFEVCRIFEGHNPLANMG